MARRRKGTMHASNDTTAEPVKGIDSAEVKHSLGVLTPTGVTIIDALKVLQSMSPQQLEAFVSNPAAVVRAAKTSSLSADSPTRWAGDLNNFGKFLKSNNIAREAFAKRFDITPAYVSMLTHKDKATPGFKLVMQILFWTRDEKLPEFGPEDWEID